jgi:hypothetical protein
MGGDYYVRTRELFTIARPAGGSVARSG